MAPSACAQMGKLRGQCSKCCTARQACYSANLGNMTAFIQTKIQALLQEPVFIILTDLTKLKQKEKRKLTFTRTNRYWTDVTRVSVVPSVYTWYQVRVRVSVSECYQLPLSLDSRNGYLHPDGDVVHFEGCEGLVEVHLEGDGLGGDGWQGGEVAVAGSQVQTVVTVGPLTRTLKARMAKTGCRLTQGAMGKLG